MSSLFASGLTPAQRKRLERQRRKQGIPPDPERSRRNAARSVPVVDMLDGTRYPSMSAAAFATGVSDTSIAYALSHPKTPNASRWRRAD